MPCACLKIFLTLAAFIVPAVSASSLLEAAEKPNVLFISVDDMNHDLGCYGNSQIHSPNIDSLARRGVVFERAYCQFPLCSPSRSSMLTGRRPDAIRIYDLKTHFRDTVPAVVTLPQLFRQNGYFTARAGKIYHYGNPGDIGTDGLDDKQSWDQVINPSGRDKAEEHLIENFTSRRGLGSSISVLKAEGTDEEQTDGMVASEIIKLLEQHKDEPFFLAAGFYRPHSPYVAPAKYFDLYPLDAIELPGVTRESLADVPNPALASTNPWPWFGVTREQARLGKQAYYASISFVDAQVGRLMETLERLELLDKTIVVFWSDHGYFIGEKGLWKKQSAFERVARAPLIISAPGLAQGSKFHQPVEFIDLYPTLADLAELTLPEGLDGSSLRPVLEDPALERNRPAYTQVHRGQNTRGYSVRTARWRYTEWGTGGERGIELYDHAADPEEDRNLAADPAYAAMLAELQPLLHKVSQP